MAETAVTYSDKERRLIDPKRDRLTLLEKAVLTASNRFKAVRPANLATEQFTEGYDLRRAVAKLFDRLEGKLDAALLEKMKAGFGRSVDIWDRAGLFTDERVERGYARPDFGRDYGPLLTPAILDMTEPGEALDRGYGTPIFAPMDVPLHDENEEKLSYLKLLKDALLWAYNGAVGGKQPNTLLVGPEKRVLTAGEIDLNDILWRWDRYLRPGVVHDVKKLDPQNHGGVSETELLKKLSGVEGKTAGVFRLERDQLVMPRDIGNNPMSGQDWVSELLRNDSVVPKNVSAQDLKQAIAYVIYCLETQGWMPDFYDHQHPETSRIALAPGTYVPPPDKGQVGAAGCVPALRWGVGVGQFDVGARGAGHRDSAYGVRGGVRIREKS